MLTPGEAQRLAIARVLYHKPVILFLDEATSQLDINNERIVYQLLQEYDVTFISVGHRLSIRQYHHSEITISDDTSYIVSQINT